MRYRLYLILLLTVSCSTQQKTNKWVMGDFTNAPGWTSVFQTFTSDTQTTINILRPHLTEMSYYVFKGDKNPASFKWNSSLKELDVVKTTSGKNIHWKVDRVHIKGLNPQTEYALYIVNKKRKKLIDWREFKTLNINKKKVRYIVGSCMSDSHAFEHVRSRIWDRMLTHDADFLMLLGDQVYVDDFGFVKREKANETDIWRRYIDSFRKIPLFSKRKLIPILSTWDDHDFGTNNSNKNFPSKNAAYKVYQAFFGGVEIPNVISKAEKGVYFSFDGFGQKFLFMDNRYFREPLRKKTYGQWGEKQHTWFRNQLFQAKTPVWIANGGQFFTEATFMTRKNGKPKQLNETFLYDHPTHFKTLIKDIKKSKQPVMFLSGDIHYSEISRVEPEMLGYETYEITSSPIHSYIYRSKTGKESWLNNPRRMLSIKEHNYVLIDSQVGESGDVKLMVESFGVKQKSPYFKQPLEVKRKL